MDVDTVHPIEVLSVCAPHDFFRLVGRFEAFGRYRSSSLPPVRFSLGGLTPVSALRADADGDGGTRLFLATVSDGDTWLDIYLSPACVAGSFPVAGCSFLLEDVFVVYPRYGSGAGDVSLRVVVLAMRRSQISLGFGTASALDCTRTDIGRPPNSIERLSALAPGADGRTPGPGPPSPPGRSVWALHTGLDAFRALPDGAVPTASSSVSTAPSSGRPGAAAARHATLVPGGRGTSATRSVTAAPVVHGSVAVPVAPVRRGRGGAAARAVAVSASSTNASAATASAAIASAAVAPAFADSPAAMASPARDSSDPQRRVRVGSARPRARKSRGEGRAASSAAASAGRWHALDTRERAIRDPARPARRAASAGVLQLVLTENGSEDSDESLTVSSESDDPDDETAGVSCAVTGRRGADDTFHGADMAVVAADAEQLEPGGGRRAPQRDASRRTTANGTAGTIEDEDVEGEVHHVVMEALADGALDALEAAERGLPTQDSADGPGALSDEEQAVEPMDYCRCGAYEGWLRSIGTNAIHVYMLGYHQFRATPVGRDLVAEFHCMCRAEAPIDEVASGGPGLWAGAGLGATRYAAPPQPNPWPCGGVHCCAFFHLPPGRCVVSAIAWPSSQEAFDMQPVASNTATAPESPVTRRYPLYWYDASSRRNFIL